MREIRHDIRRWYGEGHSVALAQVIKTWGSSPRVAGSVMAVCDDVRLAGSVSGGCIEGAVAQSALECLETGEGRVEEFHASTERAQEVGLSCGGNIDVLVAPLDATLFALESALLEADREYVRVSVARTSDGEAGLVGRSFVVGEAGDVRAALAYLAERTSTLPKACGDLSRLELVEAQALADDAGIAFCSTSPACTTPAAGSERDLLFAVPADLLAQGHVMRDVLAALATQIAGLPRTKATGLVHAGDIEWFYSRCFAQPQLICIGGTHVSVHLSQMAKALGYRTVVIDPRGVFATEERFPFVDELVLEWPQDAFSHVRITPQTALCALTHDPKIDVPALAAALESPAFYIGSLGRTTTQLSRYEDLRALGYSDEAISRVFGPIGLDLRGRGPAEIALAVMAEITAVRYGGGAAFGMSTMVASAHKAQAEK